MAKLLSDSRPDLKVGEQRAVAEQREKIVAFYQEIGNMQQKHGQKPTKTKKKTPTFKRPAIMSTAGPNGARPSKLIPTSKASNEGTQVGLLDFFAEVPVVVHPNNCRRETLRI